MDVFTQPKARGFWISLSCTLWQSEYSVLDKGDPEGLPLNKHHKLCCCLVTKLCPTFCDTIDCSTPGFPVPQHLPAAQIHVHWIGDAVQPSHSLSSSTSTFNFPQHQGLFQWFGSSHQVAKVLELQLQPQSFQWIFRVDFLLTGLITLLSKRLNIHS